MTRISSLMKNILILITIPLMAGTPIMSYKRPYSKGSHDKKVVCYLGSWAVYRPGNGKFPIESIDPYICTHLIYGFAGLGWDNRIKSLDSYYDLEENYGKGAFKRFNNLKLINPELKTIIAIGGWNEGSVKYSNMAASPDTRRIFVESCVEFIKKYGFDGLDMDWEYPGARGGKKEDKQNFVALLKELREAFDPHGFLLTAAVSAGKHFIDPAYDIPQVSRYLDFINVMCYDYHGGWETKTGHHAPLYPRPDDPEEDQILNVNFSVNYWISQGAPREKLILGMGLYGRSFTLRKEEDNGIRAEAPQRGQAGPYTREPGSLGYNEICESQMREKWTIVQDPYYMSPYAYKGRQWVGYDDLESITKKAEYAKAMGLGGGMVWSIETDDFLGLCHGQKYPMLTAINNALGRDVTSIPTPPPTSPTPSTAMTTSTTTMSPTWWPQPSSSPMPSSSTTMSSTWWPQPTTTTTTSSSSMPTMSSTWWSQPSTASESTTKFSEPTTRRPFPGVGSGKLPCPQVGLHPHPNDCQKFYHCILGVNHNFEVIEYSCPIDTVFDRKRKSCAWPQSVPECKNYFLKKYAFLGRFYHQAPSTS